MSYSFKTGDLAIAHPCHVVGNIKIIDGALCDSAGSKFLETSDNVCIVLPGELSNVASEHYIVFIDNMIGWLYPHEMTSLETR